VVWGSFSGKSEVTHAARAGGGNRLAFPDPTVIMSGGEEITKGLPQQSSPSHCPGEAGAPAGGPRRDPGAPRRHHPVRARPQSTHLHPPSLPPPPPFPPDSDTFEGSTAKKNPKIYPTAATYIFSFKFQRISRCAWNTRCFPAFILRLLSLRLSSFASLPGTRVIGVLRRTVGKWGWSGKGYQAPLPPPTVPPPVYPSPLCARFLYGGGERAPAHPPPLP